MENREKYISAGHYQNNIKIYGPKAAVDLKPAGHVDNKDVQKKPLKV
jgi:hypothetical protein